MMRLKAKLELDELKKQPPPDVTPTVPPSIVPPPTPTQPTPPSESASPSVADVKKGLEKAVELSPKAEAAMKQAIAHLREKDAVKAAVEAETARKILDEIMNAQPKDKEQEKNDQDKKEQEKKDDEKKEKDQKEKDKQDQQKKDDEKKQDEKQQQKGDDKKQEMSPEQAEALLRQIREREQERRKKQKEKEVRVWTEDVKVDKDW
jgi:colicin import membrane protein